MIEFFFWQDCPSYERALATLRDEMRLHGVDESQLTVRDVSTEEEAELLNFPGSPTIRFDGTDLQDPGGAPSGLTCRVYSKRDGRPSPLPDAGDLRDAVAAYAARHAGANSETVETQ